MIPSLSSRSSESDEKQPDMFAYVSVDGSQGKEKLLNVDGSQGKEELPNDEEEKENLPNVDGSQGKKKLPKILRGQIKKCNLTKARMVGGVTLAEVRSSVLKTIKCLYVSASEFQVNNIL